MCQEQEEGQTEEQALQGMEIIAKAEDFWFKEPEEKRHQMLVETVEVAYVINLGSPAKAAQAMFRVGYYYGRKG